MFGRNKKTVGGGFIPNINDEYDKCGFGCKIRKTLETSRKTYQKKKAQSLGFSSHDEWSKAKKTAIQKGRTQKGMMALKEIVKKAAGKTSSGGGFWGSFDKFMGTPTAKTKAKKKANKKPIMINGVKYYKARAVRPKRKPRTKRKSIQRDFFGNPI